MKKTTKSVFFVGFVGAVLLITMFPLMASAQVPETINYQGKLTDDVGAPWDGICTVRFYLYDALTGGTSLWDEQQSVLVNDGIYNVQLGSVNPLDSDVFAGDEVYLEVVIYSGGTTNGETLSPRQRVTSLAYAFQAENAQALQGYGSVDFASAAHQHSGDDITSGSVDEAAIDPDIARDLEITWGNLSGIPSDIADGDQEGIITETDPTVDPSVKDGVSWSELSDLPGDIADGDDDSGGDITGVTAGTGLSGGGSSGEVSLEVAVPLSLTDDIASGGIISCENTNERGFGGFFEASGASGWGVLGRATGRSGQGVQGFAMGEFGRGVHGWATGISGQGVNGYATGASGRGAYGYATGTFGWGVFGEASNTYGRGVSGYATNSGNAANYGGYFQASGIYGIGVYGKTTGNSSYGVYGDATGSGTAGYFTSTSGYGLIVENGNVGIGTTTPNEQLEITGTLRLPTTGLIRTGSRTLIHTIGTGNIFVGADAGNLSIDGNYNTGTGEYALNATTIGDHNTAAGYAALSTNTIGRYNTANGSYALLSNTSASNNTAVGRSALMTQSYDNGGSEWGTYNTAVGVETLYSNQPTSPFNGMWNTALGAFALRENTTGNRNTASGIGALSNNTTGNYNTAGGDVALTDNTTGSYNTASGSGALNRNISGEGNTASGLNAVYYNTTGHQNTAIGANALLDNSTGSNNTALGYHANVATGNLTNATAIGYEAQVNASNKVVIGNTSVTSIGGYASWSNFSDLRVKTDIQDIKEGLDFIQHLRPVSFRMKKGNGNADFGFVAQDIEKLIGKSNNLLDMGGGQERMLSLRYTQFIAPMVKAMQEQQAQIEQQQEQIRELKKIVEGLKNSHMPKVKPEI